MPSWRAWWFMRKLAKMINWRRLLWTLAGSGLLLILCVAPLLFVINDGKQGDQLCGRMIAHHRSCNCVYDDLDNPHVDCTFLYVESINNACRHGSGEDLQELTMYRVDNAFNRIQMGQNVCCCWCNACYAACYHHVLPHLIQERLSARNNRVLCSYLQPL